jgi:hypothetical protein
MSKRFACVCWRHGLKQGPDYCRGLLALIQLYDNSYVTQTYLKVAVNQIVTMILFLIATYFLINK